ncbi:translocation/assembly module TamB domain-containing protein [Synechococcus sp. R55.3]|uniref:translocation/assembly module TamB domain-containing protein n=1 Tax=Synechococcus sp. R55.3 TaxID=2969647 RepID=UPI0039C11358
MQQRQFNLSPGALAWVGAGLGLGLTAAAFGAAWGAAAYLQTQVLPQVEDVLSQATRRRVELGEVRFLSPWQVSLGESRIEHLATIGSIDLSPDFWTWLRTGERVLNVTLNRPQLLLMETLDRGWADVQFQLPEGEGEGSLPFQGLNIRLRQGSLTAIPLVGERRQFDQLQAQVQVWLPHNAPPGEEDLFGGRASFQAAARLRPKDSAPLTRLEGRRGYPLQLRGVADFAQASGSVSLSAARLPLDLLPSVVPAAPFAEVQGETGLALQVLWRRDQPLALTGQAQVQQARLGLEMLPHPFEEVNGSVGFTLQGLELQGVSGRLGQLSFTELKGPVDWSQGQGFGLQAELVPASLQQIQETFDVTGLPVAVEGVVGGSVTVTGPLDRPQIRGQLRGLSPGRVDRLPVSEYAFGFHFADQTLTFEAIDLRAAGGRIQGSGQLQWAAGLAGQFQLQVTGMDAEQVLAFYGGDLPRRGALPWVGPVSAQVQVALTGSQPQVEATWATQGGEIAGRGQLQLLPEADGWVVEVPQAVLAVEGGQAQVAGRWAGGQVQAQVSPQNVPLAFFNPQWTGSLSGALTAQVNTAEVSELGFLGALRAQGSVILSQPLGEARGQVAWDGAGLVIQEGEILADATRLAGIRGRIPVDPQTLQVGSLDLALAVDGVSLAEVPGLPPLVEGVLQGSGQIRGSLDNLEVEGEARLQGLSIAGVEFEDLAGSFQGSARGVEVDLQGQQDRLALQLDPQLQPLQFQVRRGEAEAVGQRQQEQLQVTVNRLPLALLGGLAAGPWASLQGNLDGEVAVDLASGAAQGRAAVADLQWGGMKVQGFSVDFDYQTAGDSGSPRLTIAQAQLDLFESTYTARGTLELPATLLQAGLDPTLAALAPQIDLEISTHQGRLEDIISAFKWRQWRDLTTRGFQLPPLGPASVLETDPVGLPNHPLLEQLEYYAQILAAHLETLASRMDPLFASAVRSTFPPPTSLRGEFQGSLSIAGNLAQPRVSFQLEGRNWQAEEFGIETLTAVGSLVVPTSGAEGAVVLEPLLLRSGERQALFSGRLGLEEQSGSLQIQGFPLALLDRFLPEELELQGDLNLDVELAGNLRDPRATGSLTVVNAQINQVPLREVAGQFDYQQGQLRLKSTLLANGDEPIRIAGLVPYTLPFAEVQAKEDQIDLSLQAENGGLRLINLLTDQVRWEGGQSQLELTIRGTLREPSLQGNLSVNSGILKLAALPEPITDLTGQIAFNLNQLQVQELRGQLGEGSLVARGVLPINSRGALQEGEALQPLSLQLQGIRLNLPNLYTGRLEGEVVVGGLLLRPLIEGRLEVSEGIVDVSPRPEPPTATEAAEDSAPPTFATALPFWQPRLNGLELALGSRIRVQRPNLFEFNASGTLRLFGTPQDPRPAGTITLERGRVSLPIANFRLDRSRPNTATFDLDNPFDPFLNLRLMTQAFEVYRFPQDLSPFDTNRNLPGSQQSIDIFATVNGRASQLAEADPRNGVLSLSSSPSRSPEEIVALLGGTALAQLNPEAGVAGLAGTALLSELQEALRDTLGLDEIRLSPIPQIDTRAPNRSSVGLALEVARDLGPATSLSLQRNLTDPFQPTRYSARYRFNEQTLTRASTDFEGNNVISIEFETRF